MSSLTVRTKNGKYIEVGQFYDGTWYARTPDWFPFSHTYLVKSSKKEIVLAVIAAQFGIESIE